jgi:anti-sigma regulatory factor (Ser/Thr protein kinase)
MKTVHAAPVEVGVTHVTFGSPADREPVRGICRPLSHDPAAPGEARRLARRVLDRWRIAEDSAHAVLLVVTELVTNAVEHAHPPVVMQLHRGQDDGRVWVEVTDGGPAERSGPWTESCADDEHGRGLDVVEALAEAHGFYRHASGSTSWACLDAA